MEQSMKRSMERSMERDIGCMKPFFENTDEKVLMTAVMRWFPSIVL